MEAIFGWGVVFAKFILMAAANSRSIFVNTAAPIELEVAAGCIKHQKPAIIVLVYPGSPVRNLPEQNLEIIF